MRVKYVRHRRASTVASPHLQPRKIFFFFFGTEHILTSVGKQQGGSKRKDHDYVGESFLSHLRD